jgi:hypothetical protein
MEGYFIGTWIASIVVGTMIASQRDAPIIGFIICLLFGPIGVFGCAFLEGRIRCPQCGTHLNERPKQCPSCWSWFRWKEGSAKCEWIPYEFRRNEPTPKAAKHSEPE